jgi:hypothetical protein
MKSLFMKEANQKSVSALVRLRNSGRCSGFLRQPVSLLLCPPVKVLGADGFYRAPWIECPLTKDYSSHLLGEKNGIIKELDSPSYKIFQEALLAMSALLMHHLVNFKRINGITDQDDITTLSPVVRKEKSRASSAGTATRTDSARTTGSVNSTRVEEDEERGKRSVVISKAAAAPQSEPNTPPKKRRVAKQNSKKRLRRQNTEGVKRQRRV